MKPPCSIVGCERPHVGRSYCQTHYMQKRRAGTLPPLPPKRDPICIFEGCDKPHLALGYCCAHYCQYKKTGRLKPLRVKQISQFTGRHFAWTENGYRAIYVDGKTVLEHRYVYEQYLCRPLHPFETVHHKNGLKGDNNLSNLELWSSSHAYGQRVEDLVDFVVTNYSGLVATAMRSS